MQLLLLGISSFWLGALHALEPGHGKTVVGAYLIGSKGRVSDAVFLGLVVTFTHTGIVILLAVLSTVAAAYFVPDTVQQVLEVVSGLLIVAVGGWMIGVRYRQARRPASAKPASPAQQPPHTHAGAEHVHEPDATHSHEPGAAHSHAHGEHGHSHDGHSHGFGRQHQHQVPNLAPGQRPSLAQLLALGVSGGIVPCPAALAVLLAAVAYGSYVRGIALVLIFSLGMATVLVAIGLLMLKAANFAGKYVAESRWTRIVPIVSAVLITLVGVGLTIKALVGIL